jgi:cyclic pyranopterin phosphate synthase
MPDKDFFQDRSLAAAKARRLARPQPQPSQPPVAPEAKGRMADVTAKPIVRREAVAEGFLRLKPETLDAIAQGRAPKGEPFGPARIAGIMAAKNTPQIVPLCHPIPLTSIEVELTREERGVRCRATIVAEWKTGVEMEALAAVSAALLTVWDMTKALEKDASGNYPDTAIEAVRVLRKTKGVQG